MNAAKKPARFRRSKEGLPFCKIRFRGLHYAACTVGSPIGTALEGYGETPKSAREDLETRLGEPTEPYDEATRQLLRTPYKRTGQDPGGKPTRLSSGERSSSRFTMRFSDTERAQLRAWVAAHQVPSEAEAVRSGLRKLGALPPE